MACTLETEYPKWFDETIYLDPNDFGPEGYAVIGPLMMFYRRVVVHSPSAVCAKEALSHPEYEKTVLTVQELDEAAVSQDKIIREPILSFTAFPTFMDPVYRANLSARYQIREAFDRKLVDPNSSLFRSVHIVGDKRRTTASIAKSLFETKPQIIREVDLIIDQHKRNIFGLPQRYAEAVSGVLKWPEPLKGLIEDLDLSKRVVLLAAYDFLNDKVLQAGGGAAISVPTAVGYLAADLLHGFEQFWDETISPVKGEEAETLTTSSEGNVLAKRVLGVNEIRAILAPCLTDAPRLSLQEIRKFREKYRQEFLSIVGKIFAKISEIDDPNERIEKCKEEASKALIGSWFAVGSQTIIEAVLGLLNLMLSGDVNELVNLMYNRIGKSVPLVRNRWAYWFKDRAGYRFLKGRIRLR